MTDVREADLTDVLGAPAGRGEVTAPQGPAPGGQGVPRAQGAPGLARPTRHRMLPAIRWRPILMMILYLSPTLVAGTYYGFISTGRYVSHAVFVVRTASKPVGGSGFGSLLKMVGLGRSEDDTYSVKNYLESRDAVRELGTTVSLADIYGRPGTDMLSRFPSFIFPDTKEDLYRYYTHMVTADYAATSGVTTLQVQAFRPDDALKVATGLLDLAERLVNKLNERIHTDAVTATQDEVKREEDRLTNAQVAITAFQNKNTMIDPVTNSVIVSEVVGKLQNDLAQQQARIADMSVSSPNNPALGALRRQAAVTQDQIAREQARVTTQKEGLADKLGEYQRLVIEREFATKALGVANTALDNARNEARRKQLYIERIVEPELSDKPTLPLRLWTTFTVLMVNIFVLFIGWMLTSGVREHISSTK